MSSLEPPENNVFYEDNFCCAWLVSEAVAEGHTIVALKEEITDINNIPLADYKVLAEIIYFVRDALIKVFKVDNVYILYINDRKRVHFHLIPRAKGGVEGLKLLTQAPHQLSDKELENIHMLRFLMESFKLEEII